MRSVSSVRRPCACASSADDDEAALSVERSSARHTSQRKVSLAASKRSGTSRAV